MWQLHPSTSRQRQQREHSKRVADLLETGAARMTHLQMGCYTVASAAADDKLYHVNIADGSCSCGNSMCHHAEAVSRHMGAAVPAHAKGGMKQLLMAAAVLHISNLLGQAQPAAEDQHVYKMPAAAGGEQTYVACIGGDHVYCQCWSEVGGSVSSRACLRWCAPRLGQPLCVCSHRGC